MTSAYVDPLRVTKLGLRCHLVVPAGRARLHAFARGIGVSGWSYHQRTRFPHYDLTPEQRARAVAAGAVELTTRDLILTCRREQL